MDIIPVLSHEIRSPLTIIRAYADVLMHSHKALTDEETKQYASAIKRAVDQANRLISNVLDASLCDSGCLSLVFETFSLEQLISRTVREVRQETRRHTIETLLPPELPEIEADEAKIERVLRNLLSNAVKFSRSDGKVFVSAHSVYCAGDVARTTGISKEFFSGVQTPAVVVSIEDNGIGIRQEEQERIFTKFYRNPAAASRGPGLGIGLYVCKQIIEGHGGRIWVRSQPQRGSEFSFILPVHRRDSTRLI